jgi:ABC-type transport system substrate-binding protein/DNA-binding SARP family transcriptional activator
VDLHLLGPVEALLDGRPVALGAPKQRAVLAMLALRVGHTVSADRLAEGLWGEHPPPSAPKMVQLYVSHLRRLLDGNGAEIVTHGRGYELRLVDGDVDALQFERLLDEARPREALALWHGEALADLADEPFAASEIRRLDGLRLHASELAIDADIEAGRHGEVIGELEALVDEHPLREQLHARRMLALYRCGRQAEALEAYRDARTVLVEQVGVEPGGELRRLQDAILAQDPALDGATAPPPTQSRPPPARPPPHRRTRALIAAAAVLLLAGAAAFGISRVLEPDGLPGIDENAVGVIDPDSGRITPQYGVGRGPGAVVVGGGSTWVANALDGTISRIDREHGQVVTIPVGGAPHGLAFGNDALWVADGNARRVVQIDPGSNKVQNEIDVGNAPTAVGFAGGALWVASGVDGKLDRIELGSDRRRPIALGSNPTAMAAGAGALWVASEEAGTVTRIEPRSGTVVRAIPVGNGPSAVATGEGAVWVVNGHDGTVWRIDPARNAVSGIVRVGGEPTAVAAGGGAVWVAGGEDGTIARVDPETTEVVERIHTGNSPSAVTVAGGRVWATAGASQATHRGGTLRVLLPSILPVLVSIDWLDWDAYTWQSAEATSLAYDGLVAYRRVSGAAGATIVGALATDAPRPSHDGRTYVFTLRRGVRYSDGRPVRPEDFRASMERFLRITRRQFSPLFAGIVGAPQCVRRPARCDLSRGIETDSRAGTITIHLTRRDGEFLHKLTQTFAFVVPSDTPMRLTGDRAPPGTGPYRFANWKANTGGTLVRNRYFRARAGQARPAGFADRIEIELHDWHDTERRVADVQRGAADVVVLAGPFDSHIKRERLAQISAGSPGRVHSAPAATTEWMFLNVRRRPFDSIRVRRALNYATDRARMVDIRGGPEFASPTCQIVPRGFPAYQPYCPYTANPTSAGGWTAPDVARARHLIAQSGRAGERVVVWASDPYREIGRYFTALLRKLGFRASLRVLSENAYFPTVGDPRTRPQIGIFGWSADYLSPSTFISQPFTCAELSQSASGAPNRSRLCDPRLERQVDRALAAQGAQATATWAAADRRVVDLAAVVPQTNRRAAVFVSKRVGNFQNHLQWFTLLDQLWVR